MSGEVYTTMGTRILLLTDGGSVLVTKDESELVKLSVQAPDKRRVDLALTPTDCLGLIEFLAVAARPGSGKPLVEMPADLPPGIAGLEPNGTTCSECHEPQFRSRGGLTCPNYHGGAPPDP